MSRPPLNCDDDFNPFLHELVKDRDKLDSIFDAISKRLMLASSKPLAQQAVKVLSGQCAAFWQQPEFVTIIQLVRMIDRKFAFSFCDDIKMPFCDLFTAHLQQAIPIRAEDADSIEKRFGLISELVRQGVRSWTLLKHHLSLMSNSSTLTSFRFQLRLLGVLSELIECRSVAVDSAVETCWSSAVRRLRSPANISIVASEDPILAAEISFLRPEKPGLIRRPQQIQQQQGEGLREDVRSSPNKETALPGNSHSVAIQSVMAHLARDPNFVPAATKIISSLIKKRLTRQGFLQDIQEILKIGQNLETDSAISSFINLMINLKTVVLKPPGEPGELFSDVLSGCVVETTALQNLAQFQQFESTFGLAVKLHRAGVLLLDFKHLASTVASKGDELSLCVLLVLMRNLKSLLDDGIVSLEPEEVMFWDLNADRIRIAISTNAASFSQSEFVNPARRFLNHLAAKGGWKRGIDAEETCRTIKNEAIDECSCKQIPSAEKESSVEAGAESILILDHSPHSSVVVTTQGTPTTTNPTQTSLEANFCQQVSAEPVEFRAPEVEHPIIIIDQSSQSPALTISTNADSLPETITTSSESTSPSCRTASSDHDIFIRSFMKETSLNKRSLHPLKEQLQSISSQFEFASAVETITLRICDQITDENTLEEAANFCILLSKVDYGRGKRFSVELQHFCCRYLGGKSDSELAKLIAALKLRAANVEHEKKIAPSKIAAFKGLYRRRMIGCTRLVGKLFGLGFFDAKFVSLFADALLTTATENSFECLLQLFTDIGRQFMDSIRMTGNQPWFEAFFRELHDFGRSHSSSELSKQHIREIISLKEKWLNSDESQQKSRWESLEKELSNLPLDEVERPELYTEAVAKVKQLVAEEFLDENFRDFTAVFLHKIENSLLELSSRSQTPVSNNIQQQQQQRQQQQQPSATPVVSPPQENSLFTPLSIASDIVTPPNSTESKSIPIKRSYEEHLKRRQLMLSVGKASFSLAKRSNSN